MKKKLLLIYAVLISGNVFSQQQREIDLSQSRPDNINIVSGTVQLKLINTLPSEEATYKITTSVLNLLPPPINSSVLVSGPVSKKLPAFGNDTVCPKSENVKKEIDKVFDKATNEKEVSESFKKVSDLLKIFNDKCLEAGNLLLERQKARSTVIQEIPDLKPNQQITVTIVRYLKDGGEQKNWEFVMTTEKKMDSWLIHYGFTYMPNVLSSHRQYFAKADPTAANTYTITRANGNPEKAWQNASPTITFTHPFSRTYKPFMPGASFISGTNFSTYSAGLGLSGIIGYNGLVSIGAMYTQKYALNGQYKEGDLIKDNLNFDQLHYKRGCIEMFISIAIRFDKNPFSASSADKAKSGSGSTSTTDAAAAKTEK